MKPRLRWLRIGGGDTLMILNIRAMLRREYEGADMFVFRLVLTLGLLKRKLMGQETAVSSSTPDPNPSV